MTTSSTVASTMPTTSVEINAFDGIHQFLELPYEDRTSVIKLGLHMQKHGKQLQLSTQNASWQAEMTETKQKHARELAVSRQECDSLRSKISELTRTFSAEKTTLASTITENAHATFKSQLDNLRQQNTVLEGKLANASNEHHQILRGQLKEQREFYEAKLTQQSQGFETIRSTYEERLNTAIGRSQNSTIKGKDSEEELFTSLNQLFPTAIIEDTHNIPGRGDFIVRFDDVVMMVETKNYTRNVQKSEVDKFYRDMESQANSDIQCGLLLSMNCGICAYDDFALEVRSGKPMMFLHNIRDNITHIRIATHMFRLILGQKSLDLSNTELRGRLAQLAKSVKSNYQRQKNHLDKYYKQSLGFIEDQQTNIRELFTSLCVKY